MQQQLHMEASRLHDAVPRDVRPAGSNHHERGFQLLVAGLQAAAPPLLGPSLAGAAAAALGALPAGRPGCGRRSAGAAAGAAMLGRFRAASTRSWGLAGVQLSVSAADWARCRRAVRISSAPPLQCPPSRHSSCPEPCGSLGGRPAGEPASRDSAMARCSCHSSASMPIAARSASLGRASPPCPGCVGRLTLCRARCALGCAGTATVS